MSIFKQIPEEEFYALDRPILFEEDDKRANNNFATISDGSNTFKVSWNSDLAPLVTEISPKIYSVGIDQHFAVIDFASYSILLSLTLFYNFYDVEIVKDWIFVISELEVLKVSKFDFTIKGTYALPNFFTEIRFIANKVEITCSEGEVITAEISS